MVGSLAREPKRRCEAFSLLFFEMAQLVQVQHLLTKINLTCFGTLVSCIAGGGLEYEYLG